MTTKFILNPFFTFTKVVNKDAIQFLCRTFLMSRTTYTRTYTAWCKEGGARSMAGRSLPIEEHEGEENRIDREVGRTKCRVGIKTIFLWDQRDYNNLFMKLEGKSVKRKLTKKKR